MLSGVSVAREAGSGVSARLFVNVGIGGPRVRPLGGFELVSAADLFAEEVQQAFLLTVVER